MKRLVFCFDGTWNRLSAPNPTNVVLTAQSITPVTEDGVAQVIHYDPGVGTGADDKWKGGLFGAGLIDKIVEAYTFLVFNYDPGDEIFVFGFSRGAFTARAFVGFIRQVGIIQRKYAPRIADAVALYKKRKPGDGHNLEPLLTFRLAYSPQLCIDREEDAWRVANSPGYKTGAASVLRIKYVGVWDTVAAVGVPSDIFFAPFANRDEQYFDSDLSPLVVSARHAVAIDEDRTTFKPTLWPNFRDLNASLGYQPYAEDAPYQQKWFPGVHGSVGGGGDIRGLSDAGLVWILDGAQKMGLAVDNDPESPLYALAPNALAPLANVTATEPTVASRLEGIILHRAAREGGPTHIEEVSDEALLRWRTPASDLPEGTLYRPSVLNGVAVIIETNAPPAGKQHSHPSALPSGGRGPVGGELYKVVYGDQLRRLAERVYGHADCDQAILSANPTISDPDRIFVGQILYLPPIDEALLVLPELARTKPAV